ncbi:DUF1488 family protein [Roseomonas sp. SSH11]|uniref:DUF1488 family protein n=1 Tax=Pararoseomonas baculiformis TaxID=2820812 RepID=A0ABS4AFX8_9PROT|nr:DUF1488 family protein [Pararoseomonas baculiformis]MBP0445910.1 DUF1488 family protein [Pararoseomonas baculiformis]
MTHDPTQSQHAQPSEEHHPAAANALALQPPRWMHDRILFEVEECGEALACSVSKAAIQDAGGRYSNLPRDIMSEFVRLRGRIERAAIAKFRGRQGGMEGPVHVWSADLDDDPEPPTTMVQSALRG